MATSPVKPARLRKVKTWHRRIALVLGLFIAFQGVTGAVSQYRFWLLGQFQPGYEAPPEGAMASPGEILASVEAQLPGFASAHVMYPAASAPETAVMVMGGYDPENRMARMVTLDQYRGEVIEDMPLRSAAGWIGLANTLHKWTIFGTTGRILLTLIGLAGIVLSLLGLWLYWNTRRVRPASRIARVHRTSGIVVGVVLLAIASTGTALNLFTWTESSAGSLVTAHNMQAGMALAQPIATAIDIDTAFSSARGEVVPGSALAAFSPAGAHARYHWFAFNSPQMRRVDVLVDPLDGAIVGVHPAGLMRGGEGLRSWLFPVHSGYLFGAPGGLLFAVCGLTLVLFLLSGIVMWWRGRRPQRRSATT